MCLCVFKITFSSQRLLDDYYCICTQGTEFSPHQVIHGLQRRVEEQEEEIMQLRRQISRLQSSQATVHVSELDKT